MQQFALSMMSGPAQMHMVASGLTHRQSCHGMQLKWVPQHDVPIQTSTCNEAVCPAPVHSPHSLRVPLKVLHCHSGLHICQAQPLVQGARKDTVQLAHILQLADPVCVQQLLPHLPQAPPAFVPQLVHMHREEEYHTQRQTCHDSRQSTSCLLACHCCSIGACAWVYVHQSQLGRLLFTMYHDNSCALPAGYTAQLLKVHCHASRIA